VTGLAFLEASPPVMRQDTVQPITMGRSACPSPLRFQLLSPRPQKRSGPLLTTIETTLPKHAGRAVMECGACSSFQIHRSS
jgi:hypothetical protein